MQSKSIAVAEVRKGFFSCRAVENISAGSFLTDLWGPVLDAPHSHTVQVGINKHVDPQGTVPAFLNHSCQPNAKFVYTRRGVSYSDLEGNYEVFWYLISIRDIKEGEDITFDYNTTEYEMAAAFKCECGVKQCLGEIKGFKYMSPKQQEERMKDLSPVIMDIWNQNLQGNK